MPFRGLTMLKSRKLIIKGGLCYGFAMVVWCRCVPGVGGVVVLAELAAAALARAARHAPPVPEVSEDEVPVLDHHTRGCGI